jgi:NADPH-dependent 2,4-dienoyl-CoA reductase/sulfur reductase-like enzyme
MDPMDQLAVEWATAKEREDNARAERIDIENKILALHPAKEEGSESFSTPAGAKVVLTGRVTYKVDIDKLIALTGAWPDDVRPVKTKVEADETRLKAIRNESPKLWSQIAAAVETKPAKTGVSIKWKE